MSILPSSPAGLQQELRQISVLGSTMAYRETPSTTDTVVLFLHGNPTSSYIWRNVLPHVAPQARCIAVDLIGFGHSAKPDIEYRYFDHLRYVEAFIDALHLEPCFLVAQDWGTAIAFHLAARHPERIRGLAFMEFIRPMPSWEDFNPAAAAQAMFQKFRTPEEGERLLMDENVFVEGVLPASIERTLLPEEMAEYRAPFATRESRRPTWRFPNDLPIAGEPADVWAAIERDHASLLDSTYPKLLFCGNPGALISPALAEEYARRLHNCRLVKLPSGKHYLQEDYPEVIGQETADWIRDHLAA